MNGADQTPLVSAIIPTRNRPELVRRAVKSVLQQIYERIEVIVVVDGLDLKTVTVLEELSDPRVRIIALRKALGVGRPET